MRYFNIFLFLALLPLLSHAQSATVASGVAASLATYRQQAVSQLRYTLDLDISGEVNAPVAATAEIVFRLNNISQPLPLDFKAPADAVQKLVINGKSVTPQLINEHLVLPAQWLRRGENNIQLSFTAGTAALNRTPEYLYTLLVPEKARTVFPCFDQPDLKAVFQLSLQLPLSWKAIANGPLKDSVVHEKSKTYHFKASDTLSTYLFAFVAGRFADTSVTIGGRTITGLYRETDTAKLRPSLSALFQIQSNALQFMEAYTQIPYPFQQFNFAALPDFQFGGMEHPGAIQYKAPTLFLEESATRDQLNARSNLLSHETAHMWFGDLVTMRWFNDVWMKEVFANFMADKIGNLTVSDNNFDLKFLTDHYPAAYNVDRTQGTHPIRQQLDNLKDAGSMYGNIIYHKAPIMMRQLELLMGADSLREGLREYLRTYAFRNASWPDLIAILDRHCTADLQAWNKVWVNESSRPVINYISKTSNGSYTSFTLVQQAEDGSTKIWPQQFEIALVYSDHTEKVTVQLNKASLQVTELVNRKVPDLLLFNTTGEGYGVFPARVTSAAQLTALATPLMRASEYLNLYENMLRKTGQFPLSLLLLYKEALLQEKDELCLNLMLDQVNSIFWRFLTPEQRQAQAPELENRLWEALNAAPAPNQQKQLFRAYNNIALSISAEGILYNVWKTQQPPAGVKLFEDDYTNIAAALCIRDYPLSQEIVKEQLTRIQNADRKLRWQFLTPALTGLPAQRDSFFAALQVRSNRTKEPWVVTAVSYLHHPLRTDYSIKYLPASLQLLEEIQQTGDIFFPQNWLQATLGYYQTKEAATMVKTFLKTHPDYNPKLRNKILQAADNIFRAEKMLDL